MRFSVASEAGLDRTLAELEAEHIRNIFASVGGHKARAAKIVRSEELAVLRPPATAL